MQTSRGVELEGCVRARGERLLFLVEFTTSAAPKISELVVPRHRVINDAMVVETLGM